MKEVTAGIDIGGIDTEIGLVGENGKCYNKSVIITSNFSNVRTFIKECVDIINQLSSKENLKVNAVGIAAPNGNPYKGTIENAVNLRWKGVIPFVEIMKELIDANSVGKRLPVTLTKDAKAAAVGE